MGPLEPTETSLAVPDPILTQCDPEPRPGNAVILMLHGGKPHSARSVDWRSTSWRRMHRLQRAITPGANAAGVSTWLLRYRERGWNDLAAPSPIPDARWALDQVRECLGDVPVVLLGHSMGARTAVHVADDPAVVGVVALAPWFSTTDPVLPLTGKALYAAHGTSDRITSPKETAAFVRRASSVTSVSELKNMGQVGHYMLRNVAAWNEVALANCLTLLESKHHSPS